MKTYPLASANWRMRAGNERAVRLSFKSRIFHLIIEHACSGASINTRVGKCMSDNGLRPRRDLRRYIRARAYGGGDRWGERKCLQDGVQTIFVPDGELRVH